MVFAVAVCGFLSGLLVGFVWGWNKGRDSILWRGMKK